MDLPIEMDVLRCDHHVEKWEYDGFTIRHLLYFIDRIASEGMVFNVRYDYDIILIRRVSCHMHRHILTFVFYICYFGKPCSGYISSFVFSLIGGDASL